MQNLTRREFVKTVGLGALAVYPCHAGLIPVALRCTSLTYYLS